MLWKIYFVHPSVLDSEVQCRIVVYLLVKENPLWLIYYIFFIIGSQQCRLYAPFVSEFLHILLRVV